MNDTPLQIGGLTLGSRLIVGTGKYESLELMREAHRASGAEMVTVAVRRIDLGGGEGPPVLDFIDRERVHLLPNTAGCTNAEDAVRTAMLAREAGLSSLIKLEVIGCPKTLMPDVPATIEAAKTLVAEGFTVLPYVTDDIVAAKRLEEIGCAAVMPLAAPIGSGLGIRNPYNLVLIKEAISIPMIVDAGVGTASDAAECMELGADGVLMNTAIAGAQDPVRMARAMCLAVEAGRLAYLAGRIPKKLYATASSPIEGLLEPSASGGAV